MFKAHVNIRPLLDFIRRNHETTEAKNLDKCNRILFEMLHNSKAVVGMLNSTFAAYEGDYDLHKVFYYTR